MHGSSDSRSENFNFAKPYMAAYIVETERYGDDYERDPLDFVFEKQDIAHFKCAICHGILDNAFMSPPCSHHVFCKGCLGMVFVHACST